MTLERFFPACTTFELTSLMTSNVLPVIPSCVNALASNLVLACSMVNSDTTTRPPQGLLLTVRFAVLPDISFSAFQMRSSVA